MDKMRPSQKRYPPELKERAVRMVRKLRLADPGDQGVVSRVARQLGVGMESLRQWVKQAEVDAGRQPGLTTVEHDERKELRKEVKELRRANDMAVSTGERRSRFSERSRLISASSSLVGPDRIPPSTWACTIHLRSVSAPTPNFGPSACAAAHADGYSVRRSKAIRVARSRCSLGYLFGIPTILRKEGSGIKPGTVQSSRPSPPQARPVPRGSDPPTATHDYSRRTRVNTGLP
jgi:transposase